jgi:hypothetical protein
MESIQSNGFIYTSQLSVCEPSVGSTKYQLIDGAHRLAAIERLSQSENEEIKKLYSNYMFKCHVLPPLQRKQQMALAYGNIFINYNSNK